MFCKNCGSPVGDNDMVCKSCGTLTEYGEKVSRHEALPPVDGNPVFNPVRGSDSADYAQRNQNTGAPQNNAPYAPYQGNPVNPDGSLNPNAYPPQNPYQGPQNGAPNPNGGYYYAPQNVRNVPDDLPKGSNGMAIAGFVCGFFIPLLGLIFSIIGLNKSKNLGGSGKGLSIAGIIISIVVWIVYFFAF